MRTFIAVEIPKDIQEAIGDYIDSIRESFKDVKWVSPENLHLTIKFLGEVKESDLKNLSGCVEKAASDFSPFSIDLSNIGFFPSSKNLKVIWIGTDGGADNLLDLFQELENFLENLGFDREARAFSPHLTIGRVKKKKKHKYHVNINPEELPEFKSVKFYVKSIAIIKSILTPQGPIYEKLYEGKLK